MKSTTVLWAIGLSVALVVSGPTVAFARGGHGGEHGGHGGGRAGHGSQHGHIGGGHFRGHVAGHAFHGFGQHGFHGVAPHQVYLPCARVWVPGYYDAYGNWVFGYYRYDCSFYRY